MATVETPCTCPRCRNPEALNEFNTRTFADTTFCNRCGSVEKIDGYSGKTRRFGGYGSYRVTYRRMSTDGIFQRRQTLKAREARLLRMAHHPEVQSITLTVRERGKWKTKEVFRRIRRVASPSFRRPVQFIDMATLTSAIPITPPAYWQGDDDIPW